MHMDCRHNGYEISGKACANRLNPLVIIKEQKERKKNLYHFSAHFAIKVLRDITSGIRAKLKRSDLMDSSTCRYVMNYVI